MQIYTYHMGFKHGGEVEVFDLTKLTDYYQLHHLYGDSIRALDMFTSIFRNETELLAFLEKKGLVKGAGKLIPLLRDHNSKGLKVRELKSGFLYEGAHTYLNRDEIINFMKKNINNPDFISSAITFFGNYFGAKEMPEINDDASIKELEQASAKIHPLNKHLVTLDRYLAMLNFDYQTTNPTIVSRRKKSMAEESLTSLLIMLDYIIYKKNSNKGPKETNYRGLRDAAIFCYNTKRQLRPEKAPKKVVDIKPVDKYNGEYDEYLSEEEYATAYPEQVGASTRR